MHCPIYQHCFRSQKDGFRGSGRIFPLICLLSVQKESCTYFGELFIWPCQVVHLADTQELGSECWQCGACAGSGGTVEDPTEGGTYLLSDDGQHSGLYSHMDSWAGGWSLFFVFFCWCGNDLISPCSGLIKGFWKPLLSYFNYPFPSASLILSFISPLLLLVYLLKETVSGYKQGHEKCCMQSYCCLSTIVRLFCLLGNQLILWNSENPLSPQWCVCVRVITHASQLSVTVNLSLVFLAATRGAFSRGKQAGTENVVKLPHTYTLTHIQLVAKSLNFPLL